MNNFVNELPSMYTYISNYNNIIDIANNLAQLARQI